MDETRFRTIVDMHWKNLVGRYPELEPLERPFTEALKLLIGSLEHDGKILLCGNGGSAADADHIAGELLKSFILPRNVSELAAIDLKKIDNERGAVLAKDLQEGVSAIVLSNQSALITAYMNDVNPDLIFAQQVHSQGREGDILIALTTSGNSENILMAAVSAKAKGLKVIGFTGKTGGKFKDYCDVCFCVPQELTYLVQELHLPLYHALCMAVEDLLWGGDISR